MQGAKESLKGMMMGWNDQMQAIPLQLHSLKLADHTGRIINENPCVHVTVKARWTVFKPRVGGLLKGVIRQQTPEHLSLLILGYFNATIPANQMSIGYRWNQLRAVWESPDGNALLCGATLEFMVLEVRRDASLITIIGSTDKLHEKKEEVQKERVVEEHVHQGATVEERKHKKKRLSGESGEKSKKKKKE